MLEFKFQPGTQKILNRIMIDGGLGAYHRGISKGFFMLGKFLVVKAQDAIKNGPKTGRIYKLTGELKRRARKNFHQASAPGEAPANLTGDLRRGVSSSVVGFQQMSFGYSSETPYGKFLEWGTRKMGARPNLVIQGIEHEKEACEFFHVEIEKAMDRWLGSK